MPCRGVALTAEANWMREGATALPVINGRPPFRRQRELVRRVQSDCSIDIDRNSYSVAWQLIGEGVEVVISNGRLRINLAGHEVAVYAETGGRRQRVVDSAPGGEACEKFIATQSRGFCRRAAQQYSTIRWPSTVAWQRVSLRCPASYAKRGCSGGWNCESCPNPSYAVAPASTVRTVPVMFFALAPSRNSTASATSSTAGKRRKALRRATCSLRSGGMA